MGVTPREASTLLCCVLSPRDMTKWAVWPVGGAAFFVEQKQGAHSRPHTVPSPGTGGLLL